MSLFEDRDIKGKKRQLRLFDNAIELTVFVSSKEEALALFEQRKKDLEIYSQYY